MNYKEKFKKIDLKAENERMVLKYAADAETEDRRIGSMVIVKDTVTKQRINKNFVSNAKQTLIELENKMNELVRCLCGEFVSDYTIELFPEDGKDHTAERNTAIIMINSLGDRMDVETLRELLVPLRYDKTGFSLVKKLIVSKKYDSSLTLELHRVFDEVLGIGGYVEILADYEACLQQIKDLIETPGKLYTYTINTVNNDLEVVVGVNKSYSMLALPTVLNEIMEKYNSICRGIPELHLEEKPFEPIVNEWK